MNCMECRSAQRWRTPASPTGIHGEAALYICGEAASVFTEKLFRERIFHRFVVRIGREIESPENARRLIRLLLAKQLAVALIAQLLA